ncbi:leucyl aminopeptidase [Balneatrix alpica]|uniref:Probable cytosol aminopeptidase n=1 Tax=Balneatrix alpica TaxID=75684 RepID=A0ABV5ZBY2_9GAMM|nr:leucyl aminopeptidase [Balneatrix alpica]
MPVSYHLTTDSVLQSPQSCVVVALYDDGSLSPAAAQLDQASQGQLSQLVQAGRVKGKSGSTLYLPLVSGVNSSVLLLGAGSPGLSPAKFTGLAKSAIKELNERGISDAALFLAEVDVKGRGQAWRVRQLVEASEQALYVFDQLKSKKADAPSLSNLTLAVAVNEAQAASEALKQGMAVAQGVTLAKNLANLPGNICTPTYLSDTARQLADQYANLQVQVLDEDAMRQLGMHCLLSVGNGSDQPSQLITLEYKGAAETEQPYVFVGKGITFDTGGISLKPGEGMDEMKFDMGGAASVLGLMKTVSELQLPINVVGVVAAAENMPSGRATKPGDVVTTMSGQTVEILNTDAEGRLVLCDALTYVARFKPATVVDIATLTGACVIALGHHTTGLMANDQELANALLQAGEQANDRCWQLPLFDEYQEQLDSNFADIANIGGRPGGSITAACFLSRFTKEYRWAHLDIAGTAWVSGKQKGATGRCVPLLAQYLFDRI